MQPSQTLPLGLPPLLGRPQGTPLRLPSIQDLLSGTPGTEYLYASRQPTLSVPPQTPTATNNCTSFGPGATREDRQGVGNTGSTHAPAASPKATYDGYLATTEDADVLLEAVIQGRLTPLKQKLSEAELRYIQAGSIFVWKRREGFQKWVDERSWIFSNVIERRLRQYYEADERGSKLEDGLCKTVCTTSLTYGIVSYYLEDNTSDLTRPSADSRLKQATSTEMESPSSIGVQSSDVDDEEDDDTSDDIMIDDELSAISPDLEGFRQHVLRLNPNLEDTNMFLVDRFSNALLDRYNQLLAAKREHSRLNETCSCGSLCLSRRSQEDLGSSSGLDIVLPPDIPQPPTHTLSAEFECPICFTLQKPNTPSEWIEHVLEDMQLFRCTWETCNVSQGFKNQKDWERHEMEKHRCPNSWSCQVVGCNSDSFNSSEELRDHRRTAHSIRSSARNLNALPPKPQDESCRFCGNEFASWSVLADHLAKHMRQISSPLLHLVAQTAVQNPPTTISTNATAIDGSALESEPTISSHQAGPSPADRGTPTSINKRRMPQHEPSNPKRNRTSDRNRTKETNHADPDEGGNTTTCNSLLLPAPSGSNTVSQTSGSQTPPSAPFSAETSLQVIIRYRVVCHGQETHVSSDWSPPNDFKRITLSQLADALSKRFGTIHKAVDLHLLGDGIDAQATVKTEKELKHAKIHFKDAINHRVSARPTNEYHCVIEYKVHSTREVVEKDDEFPW